MSKQQIAKKVSKKRAREETEAETKSSKKPKLEKKKPQVDDILQANEDDKGSIKSDESEYEDFRNVLQAADREEAQKIGKELAAIQEEEESKQLPNRLVIVKNLPHGFHMRSQIYHFFSGISPLTRCEVDQNASTAYLEFEDREAAKAVIEGLHNYLLESKVLHLEFCNVPVDQQEEQIWKPVVKRALKQNAENKKTQRTVDVNSIKRVQKLEHFSGHVPEKCYVMREQRKRDQALQRQFYTMV